MFGVAKLRSSIVDWEDGYGSTRLAFETRLPLTECKQSLAALDNTVFSQHPKTKVELTQLDHNTYEFRIKRYGYRFNSVMAQGYLQRADDQYTVVECDVSYTESILRQNALIAGVGLLFTALSFGNPGFVNAVCVTTLFVIFGSLMQWSAASHNRDELMVSIKTALCVEDCRDF